MTYFTLRGSIQAQWRGSSIENRAIGRSWTMGIVVESAVERQNLLILVGTLVSYTIPDGKTGQGLLFLEADSWMVYPCVLGIRIEEVV